jgi:hypothetical protein
MQDKHYTCLGVEASAAVNAIIARMVHDAGKVNDPDRDRRVSDADRVIDDRRRDCLAMIQLWMRSSKPYAREELAHWRDALKEIDLKAARTGTRGAARPWAWAVPGAGAARWPSRGRRGRGVASP